MTTVKRHPRAIPPRAGTLRSQPPGPTPRTGGGRPGRGSESRAASPGCGWLSCACPAGCANRWPEGLTPSQVSALATVERLGTPTLGELAVVGEGPAPEHDPHRGRAGGGRARGPAGDADRPAGRPGHAHRRRASRSCRGAVRCGPPSWPGGCSACRQPSGLARVSWSDCSSSWWTKT